MRCLGIVSFMATCFVALYMHLTYRHEYAPVLEVCDSRFRRLLLEICCHWMLSGITMLSIF
jgi:hypothetical protein